MFQAAALQACFAGLVGFYQRDDPSYPTIDTDLASSGSGLFVQGVHPIVSIENIVNSAPEFKSFAYPDWAANTAYNLATRVIYQSSVYQAKAAIPNTLTDTPAADATNWRLVDPFSEWLRRLYNESCSNLANTIIRQKKLQYAGKSLLESQQLYQGYGMLIDKVIKRGRFVGFEITTVSAQGLATTIPRVALQADTAQTITFYLYNSSQADPVKTFEVEIQKANVFSWANLADALVGYMSNSSDAGSRWYFGYYEDDLTGQVVQKNIDFSRAPCQSCDQWNISAYNNWSKYSGIQAFYVAESDIQVDKTLWAADKVQYVYDTNWGINLDIAVTCDITNVLCANKYVLADALRMQIALDLLNCIGFATRINVISDMTKKMARAELSEKPGSGSFKLIYLDAVKAANMDLTGLNKTCFPDSTRGRISYGAI